MSVGFDLGGGATTLKIDDEKLRTSGFVVRGSVVLRDYRSSGLFVGGQASLLGGDLRTRDVDGGLRLAVPVDIQLGATVATPFAGLPATIYAFGGPMWGENRLERGARADRFHMFGGSVGFGADLHLTNQLALGVKARWFGLEAINNRFDGATQRGVIVSGGVSYGFVTN